MKKTAWVLMSQPVHSAGCRMEAWQQTTPPNPDPFADSTFIE